MVVTADERDALAAFRRMGVGLDKIAVKGKKAKRSIDDMNKGAGALGRQMGRFASQAAGLITVAGAVGFVTRAFTDVRDRAAQAGAQIEGAASSLKGLIQIAGGSRQKFQQSVGLSNEIAATRGMTRAQAFQTTFMLQSLNPEASPEYIRWLASLQRITEDPNAVAEMIRKTQVSFGEVGTPGQITSAGMVGAAKTKVTLEEFGKPLGGIIAAFAKQGADFSESVAILSQVAVALGPEEGGTAARRMLDALSKNKQFAGRGGIEPFVTDIIPAFKAEQRKALGLGPGTEITEAHKEQLRAVNFHSEVIEEAANGNVRAARAVQVMITSIDEVTKTFNEAARQLKASGDQLEINKAFKLAESAPLIRATEGLRRARAAEQIMTQGEAIEDMKAQAAIAMATGQMSRAGIDVVTRKKTLSIAEGMRLVKRPSSEIAAYLAAETAQEITQSRYPTGGLTGAITRSRQQNIDFARTRRGTEAHLERLFMHEYGRLWLADPTAVEDLPATLDPSRRLSVDDRERNAREQAGIDAAVAQYEEDQGNAAASDAARKAAAAAAAANKEVSGSFGLMPAGGAYVDPEGN